MTISQWTLEQRPALVAALPVNSEDIEEAHQLRDIITKANYANNITQKDQQRLAEHGLRIAIAHKERFLDTLRGGYDLKEHIHRSVQSILPIIKGAVRDTRLRNAGLLEADQCVGSISQFAWKTLCCVNACVEPLSPEDDIIIFQGSAVSRIAGHLEFNAHKAGADIRTQARYHEVACQNHIDIPEVIFDDSNISYSAVYISTGEFSGYVTTDIEDTLPQSIIHGMIGTPLERMIDHPFFNGLQIKITDALIAQINGRQKLRLELEHVQKDIPLILPACKRLEGVIALANRAAEAA